MVREVIQSVIISYNDFYKDLSSQAPRIVEIITNEVKKFSVGIEGGLKEFTLRTKSNSITSKDAFDLYQNFGFPWEITEELAKEKGIVSGSRCIRN